MRYVDVTALPPLMFPEKVTSPAPALTIRFLAVPPETEPRVPPNVTLPAPEPVSYTHLTLPTSDLV